MELARGLTPYSRVSGVFRPPGSKSIAQRVLVAALLCPETTEVAGLPAGEDVAACLHLLAEAGARVERLGPDRVRVSGAGPAALAPTGLVSAGESATLARFATAVFALCRHSRAPLALHAEGTLRGRKSEPLFEALRRAGARIDALETTGSWPVRVTSALAPSELRLVKPVSSQEVSALCLAAAAQAHPVRLVIEGPVPSWPYFELTRGVLARFGASVDRDGDGLLIRGPLRGVDVPLQVEPDASSAAVALAAACLSRGELVVPGIPADSLQGDARIVEHLAAFGCAARREDGLVAGGFPAHGATLDLSGEPDLAPVLAAVAAAAARAHGSASRLTGLGTLPGKESDRIAVLADGLERCGCAVAATKSTLEIARGKRPAGGRILLDPCGDHRMAFAFALLGLFTPGVGVTDAACVAKSWPRFWEDLEALGAELTENSAG